MKLGLPENWLVFFLKLVPKSGYISIFCYKFFSRASSVLLSPCENQSQQFSSKGEICPTLIMAILQKTL